MKPEVQEAVWQEYGFKHLCYLFMQISCIFRTCLSSVSQSYTHHFHLLMDDSMKAQQYGLVDGWLRMDQVDHDQASTQYVIRSRSRAELFLQWRVLICRE